MDCYTSNSALSSYWAFEIDSFGSASTAKLFTCDDNCFGVIDAASPYLTFAMGSSSYSSLFENVGGESNCEESTLECDDEDSITYYLDFTIGNDTYYIFRSDFYYDDKLRFLWTDEIVDDGLVIFFGKPFLDTREVGLYVTNETITFSYLSSSSSNAEKWETIWITAICVVAFALIFFGFFFYKFKIPPPTRRNQNEEQVVCVVFLFLILFFFFTKFLLPFFAAL